MKYQDLFKTLPAEARVLLYSERLEQVLWYGNDPHDNPGLKYTNASRVVKHIPFDTSTRTELFEGQPTDITHAYRVTDDLGRSEGWQFGTCDDALQVCEFDIYEEVERPVAAGVPVGGWEPRIEPAHIDLAAPLAQNPELRPAVIFHDGGQVIEYDRGVYVWHDSLGKMRGAESTLDEARSARERWMADVDQQSPIKVGDLKVTIDNSALVADLMVEIEKRFGPSVVNVHEDDAPRRRPEGTDLDPCEADDLIAEASAEDDAHEDDDPWGEIEGMEARALHLLRMGYLTDVQFIAIFNKVPQ